MFGKAELCHVFVLVEVGVGRAGGKSMGKGGSGARQRLPAMVSGVEGDGDVVCGIRMPVLLLYCTCLCRLLHSCWLSLSYSQETAIYT